MVLLNLILLNFNTSFGRSTAMKTQYVLLTFALLLGTMVGSQTWAQYGGSGSGTNQTVSVTMEAGSANAGDNKGYSPKEVTIAVGATVEWENKDAAGHTVTSGNPGDSDFGSLFDSTKDPSGFLIKPEGTWKHTFDKAGNFPYFCQVHPWMLGKVTVEGTSLPVNTINASTQASSFKIGDTVTISGSVNPVTLGQPVVIQVFNPSGTSFRFDEVNIGTSGSFTYNFKLEGQLAKIGNYRIDIGYFSSKKSLIINVNEGTSVTTGKISVSGTGLVDAAGSSVSKVFTDQQVLVQSAISNNQDVTQDYAYILQIKNSEDIAVSLSWVQGTINAKQSLNAAQSWVPSSPGMYKVQIFVWQSVTNPIPLASSVVELEINVSS